MALDIPLRKTTIGQKSISFLRPKIWSKTNNSLKAVTTTFTHALKKTHTRKSDNLGSYFLFFWGKLLLLLILLFIVSY